MSPSAAGPRLPMISSLSLEDCRLLVDSVTDYAVFMLNVDGRVLSWNRGAEKIKGYAAEEIVGEHFSKFYPPEDIATSKPERMLAKARELGRVEDEGWRVRKGGSRFWANVVITALHDEKDLLRGYAKVTRDLSERKQTEEELRRSEERFRLLVAAVADYAIYMLDPEGRITTWNSGAERMKGYTESEILGRHFSIFFPEEAVRAGKPERELELARTTGHFEDEAMRIRKDGTAFYANVIVTPIWDAQGQLLGFAKVTQDLTARRLAQATERKLLIEKAAREAAERTERALRKSEEAAKEAKQRAEQSARHAEEANRAKDEFLATVSHELRTPLSVILGWASMLRGRERELKLDSTLVRAVDAIYRNAESQAKIIEDLLDMSRIITGKLRLELEPVNLATIIREALKVVEPSAAAKGIALTFSPQKENAMLLADPERLRQVAWNLLANAVKFTDRGGRVTVNLEQEGSSLSVTVADTGAGIAPELLPYVFERFKQGDSSTKRKYGGLGLGLAIVRHIVELHGGRVHAESTGMGRGALFKVTLPVRAVVVPEASKDAEASTSRQFTGKDSPLVGLRILVVDDDADARELLQSVLVGAGAHVETADSARAALDAVHRFHPQVLISDIGMPEEDGFSLIRRIQASSQGGKIPSIALTAYTSHADRMKALAAGFTTHIGKPVNPDDLLFAIANVSAFARR